VHLKPLMRKTPLLHAGETEPPRAVRMLVMAREGWSCCRCGRSVIGLPYTISPRKLRSKEADISPSGLILLCGTETLLCRGYVLSNVTESYGAGWLVLSREDPAMVPVLLAGRITVWLTDSGTYSTEDPEFSAASLSAAS
jgi:hypothetical protein